MMRYHVICDGKIGTGGWRIRSEHDVEQYQIDGDRWDCDGAFSVVDARRGIPTVVRPRRTWRHRIFELFRGDDLVAMVRTSLRSGIRAEFVWEMPGPDMLEVRGDFDEMNYRFVRGARTVAVVTTLGEHDGGFGIEVRACEEQSLILAAALAVRCLCDDLGAVRGRPHEERGRAAAFESGVRVAS